MIFLKNQKGLSKTMQFNKKPWGFPFLNNLRKTMKYAIVTQFTSQSPVLGISWGYNDGFAVFDLITFLT